MTEAIDVLNQGSFSSLALGVNQLLYDGGRWWNQIAQAGALEDAARLAGRAAAVQRVGGGAPFL